LNVIKRQASSLSASVPTAQAKLLTVGELASKLRCHPATIYRLVKQNKLPGFRVGADWRFSSLVIDNWIAEQVPQT
jgi:excisionase family DNA binding protein